VASAAAREEARLRGAFAKVESRDDASREDI